MAPVAGSNCAHGCGNARVSRLWRVYITGVSERLQSIHVRTGEGQKAPSVVNHSPRIETIQRDRVGETVRASRWLGVRHGEAIDSVI